MQKRGVARGDLDGLETPLVPYPPLGLDLTPTPWGEPSPSQWEARQASGVASTKIHFPHG